MKKFNSFAAIAATVALTASCASEENPVYESITQGAPIEFANKTVNITRGTDITNGDAATLLSNKFVVNGKKTVGTNTYLPFENEPVTYADSKWSHPNKVYWDMNADSYDFHAYSDANGSSIVSLASDPFADGLTITSADADAVSKVYVAPVVTVDDQNNFGPAVNFRFKNAAAKVRMAFYSNIEGYTVNVDKFYLADDSESDNCIINSGTFYTTASYKVAANGTQSLVGTPATAADLTLGDLIVNPGNPLATIGTSSETKTFDKALEAYTWVLPTQTAGTAATVKVKYRTISSTNEVTEYTKSVTIPASALQWEPNHAYTYIFCITAGAATPIEFSAVVEDFDTWSNDPAYNIASM